MLQRANQGLKSLSRRFDGRIDFEHFERLFRQRVNNDTIKIPKALEANFYHPESPIEERIKALIDEHHAITTTKHQQGLWQQKERLAGAERTLKTKPTNKKALEDQRIATDKIDWYLRKIADSKRTELKPRDSRIFPNTYAPVVVLERNQYTVVPMRYGCRLQGKPESYDQRFGGTYNAFRT